MPPSLMALVLHAYPVALARHWGRWSEKRGDFMIWGSSGMDQCKCPDRIGEPRVLLVSMRCFSIAISCRAEFGGHPGLLEALAVKLALEWGCRNADHIGKRIVMLINTRAVSGAISKGRSSARTLQRIVRRISALALATNSTLQLVYVPSQHNPADAPSGGKVYPQRPQNADHRVFTRRSYKIACRTS